MTTVTVDVEASKADNGDLSILLSPALIEKLQVIAGEVTQCSKRGRRKTKRQACGIEDFIGRVEADAELSGSLRQLPSQVFEVLDEGYEPMPGESPGWQGSGGLPGDDEGYESGDDGWFDAAEDGAEAAGDTLETAVFASEEEAAAMEASIAAGTVIGIPTTASFLHYVWKTLSEENRVLDVYRVPSSKVNKITKTTSRTSTNTQQSSTTTSSSSSCPTHTVRPRRLLLIIPLLTWIYQSRSRIVIKIASRSSNQMPTTNISCAPR